MKTGEIIYKIDNFHSATYPELRVGATYRLTIGESPLWGDSSDGPFTAEKIAALCKGMPLAPEDRGPLAGQMNRILEEALDIPREPYFTRALHRLTGANGAELGHLLVEVPGLLPPERVGHRELIGSSEVFMGPLRHDAGMFKVDLPDGQTFFGLLTKQGPVWETVHADLCERGVLPSLAAAVATLVKRAVEKAEWTGRVIKTYSKLEVGGACVTIEAPYSQPITNNEKKENEMSDTIALTPEEAEAAHRAIIEPADKGNSESSSDSLYSFLQGEFDRLRAIREAEGLTMRALYKRLPRGKGKSLSYRSFTTYYYRIAKARALAEEKASQVALVGGEGNEPNETTFVQSGFQFSMDLCMVEGDDGASLIHNFQDWIARERKGRKFLDAFIRSRELIIKPWGIESGPFCSSDAVTAAGDTIGDFLTTHGTCEGALPVTIQMKLYDMEGEEIEWVTADEVGPDIDIIESFAYAKFCVSKGELLPMSWHEAEKREEEEWEQSQARQELAEPEPMPVKEQSEADVVRGYTFEMRLEDISLPALPLPECEDDAYDTLAARFKSWLEDDLDYNADLLDAIHEKSIIIGDFGIRSGSFCPDSVFETAAHTMARFIYEMGGKRAGLTFEAEVGKYRNGRLLGMQGRPRLFRIENRRIWRPQQDAFCKEIEHAAA